MPLSRRAVRRFCFAFDMLLFLMKIEDIIIILNMSRSRAIDESPQQDGVRNEASRVPIRIRELKQYLSI